MNRILLVIKREYMVRVKKRSFLLMTILTPLLFPAILAAIIYFAVKQHENADIQVVEVLDESGLTNFKNSSRYEFIYLNGNINAAKATFRESDHKALLYIPKFDLYDPSGLVIYAKSNLSFSTLSDFENIIENRVEKLKLEEFGIDSTTIANLKTNISLRTINLTDQGEEKVSSAGVTYGIGYLTGFMIYLFIFIYGAQIMHGIIEEKNSRVVEILISSVRPFQLMMGKVIGIAAVGLTQLIIWIVMISVLSTTVLSLFGLSNPSEIAIEQVAQNIPDMDVSETMVNPEVQDMINVLYDIPFGYIIFTFIFYFIGGYLLYGALFAAVGAAVDSQADAQQFMLPIILPIIFAFIGLSTFILQDPDSSWSFWLSVIPLTSPIAMMGRIAFGLPMWELILSMLSLIGGFILTIWFAARIYRVGILFHGTKVNYRVMARWFLMKN